MELKKWSDVIKSAEYKKLSAKEKKEVKEQYPGIIKTKWSDVTSSKAYKELSKEAKISAKKQYFHEKQEGTRKKEHREAINKNSVDLKKAVEELKKQIAKINIKIPEIKLPEINLPDINLNNEGLEAVLEDLSNKIEMIKFESVQPITQWKFDIIRDREGFTKTIEAKAVNGTTTH